MSVYSFLNCGIDTGKCDIVKAEIVSTDGESEEVKFLVVEFEKLTVYVVEDVTATSSKVEWLARLYETRDDLLKKIRIGAVLTDALDFALLAQYLN